jgi:hypothetical protein
MPRGSSPELLFALFWSVACSAGAQQRTLPAQSPIPDVPPGYDVCLAEPGLCRQGSATAQLSQRESGGKTQILLSGPLSGAPVVSRRSEGLVPQVRGAVAPTPVRAPAAPTAIASQAERQRPFVDLEAGLTIETPDTVGAAARARALTERAGGQVLHENFLDTESQAGNTLSIRVPAERAHALIDELKKLGRVSAFETKSADLSRRWVDASSLLRSLEAARLRYEALLQAATDVSEMTALEKELERVRTAIDRVQTDLEWMRDRVERSVIYLRIAQPAQDRVRREAKLYPGLRLPFAFDAPARGAGASYFGGGLSVLIVRPLNFDLDLMTNAAADERSGIDLLTTTLGVELYSNLLGAGRRKFFNPYFGFRAGYANLNGDDAVALGGSLGLELFKTDFLFVEVQTRLYALLSTDQGTHVLFQPAVAVNFAY